MQLERERLDLRAQVCLLKESREAVEEELKARCAALAQNTEETIQQKAEASALRSVLLRLDKRHSDTHTQKKVKL